MERQSRPITGRDVREKLRSKQPLWKQMQFTAREKASEDKPTPPSQPEAAIVHQAPSTEKFPEEQELLTQYPPPGEDVEEISQYPPPRSRAAVEESRVEQLAKPPPSHQHQEVSYKPKMAKTAPPSAVPAPTPASTASPVPPSHHMQTGELVFSRDPVVARQQKELYSLSPQKEPVPSQPTALRSGDTPDSPEVSFKIHEVKLREKLVRRVQSFRIGHNQSSRDEEEVAAVNDRTSAVASSAAADSAERMEETTVPPPSSSSEGPSTMRPAEAPPPTSTVVAADEFVVESTGEMQQDPQNEVPPSMVGTQQPTTVEPSPLANTSFQALEAREPETGIVEGEPGEIMDDLNAETEEVGMAGGGVSSEGGAALSTRLEEGGVVGTEGERVLEEGEMEEEEADETKNTMLSVEGKCYMDMEKDETSKTKDDITKKG